MLIILFVSFDYYFAALYARDTSSGNNEPNGSIRKRSRFDEVAENNSINSGDLGRDSREQREQRVQRPEDRTERAERTVRNDRSERGDKDREDGGRYRDSRSSRDPRDVRDSRESVDRDRDYKERDSKEYRARDHKEYNEREPRENHISRDYRGDREHSSLKRHRDRDDRGEGDYESRDHSSRDRHNDRDYESRDHRYRNKREDYRRESRDRDYRRPAGNSVEIPFDKFLRLSPWRGSVTPLEERPRHLKNWDAAPSGFERIGADKAKLTGLFPPPGNIAKSSNYVPPTLDPARAAMFQLLNKDNSIPSSSSTASGQNDNTSSSNLPANLLKQARRFYIGNLPFDCSESSLMNFLENNLRGLSGASTANDEMARGDSSKVLSIAVSTDRSYAFVECRTAEDASLAMNLDGVVFEGSQRKVRRPKEYHLAITSGLIPGGTNTGSLSSTGSNNNTSSVLVNGAPTINPIAANAQLNQKSLIISGIPDILGAEHVKSLLSLVAEIRYFILLKDRQSDKSLGVAVFEFVEDLSGEEWSGPFLKHTKGSLFMGPFEMKFKRIHDLMNTSDICFDMDNLESSDSPFDSDDNEYLRNLLSVYNLQPGYATSPSSTQILQLLNLVTKESLQSDYEAICEDICSELSSHLELVVPKPSQTDGELVPGVGKVFVKYGSVEEAARSASELAGRIFDGRTCIVSFFPPDKFEKRLF